MSNSNGGAARIARIGRGIGRGAAGWLGALLLVSGADAATFTVTTNADAGAGSLRQALLDAAADADEPHTIEFALPDGDTIALASALPDVDRTITFDTQGRALTLDGSDGGIVQPYLTVRSIATFDGLSFDGGEVRTGLPGTLYIVRADQDVTIASDFTNAFGAAFSFDKDGSAVATIEGSVVLPSAIGDAFAGTLRVANGGAFELAGFNVNSTATLEVLAGGTATFGGALDVLSGGTLTGDGAVTSGSTTIRSGATLSGALALDAGSSFVLESGADLVGAGSVTATDISLAGRTSPDTTAGTLTFTGPTTFAGGSTYEADLRDDGTGDVVDASGAVTIEPGATLLTRLDPNGDYSAGTDVTVMTYGSHTGEFDFATDSTFLFLAQTPVYGANALVIELDVSTPANLALTPNQQHVLDVVNGSTPDPGGDLGAVQTVLNTTFQGDAGAYGELLDAIGGESHTAFVTGRQLLGERTARALHRRARDPAWGAARAVYAASGSAPAPVRAGPGGVPLGWRAATAAPVAGVADVAAPRPRARIGAWLDGFGQLGELEGGDFGEADLDTLLYGGTLGVDAWLDDRVLLGLAGGYARADLDPDDREGDFTSDTIQGAIYAGYADPRGYLSAYGRYAYSFQDSDREIEAPQLRRTARASWDAQDYGAGVEAGVTVVSLGTFGLQPIVGVDWLQLTEERYREKGAGSLSLEVDPEDLESTTARFGGRLFGEIDLDGTGLLVPELRGFWQREYGDTERTLRAQLLGASTGGAVAVRGAEMPRDVVILGVGWSADVGDTLQVLLDYDALLDADRVEHQGSLAVRARF